MKPNKLAVYGILKRGFELDLRYFGGTFIGAGTVKGATLYHIGSGVGLRFDDPSKVAHVEVFDIGKERLPGSENLYRYYKASEVWRWLDSIENNGRTYTRKVVPVTLSDGSVIDCWIYEHTMWPDSKYTNPIEGNDFGREHGQQSILS